MMMRIQTTWIDERARQLGFAAVGIATVEPMDATPLQQWLDAGHEAEMRYLQRHLPLRANLDAVLSGAQSAICVALPYPGPTSGESSIGAIARYARGRDYHEVVTELLNHLWSEIHARYPDAKGCVFVDGGPLPERELARRAGIGWIGRHSCLINPELGSRYVLGEILTTLSLEPSTPIQGSCGPCRNCMDACPTGALVAPGVVDARRCLSYLTIEHKGAIPVEFRSHMGTRLFGCDTCQDACPHNKRVGEVASLLSSLPDLLAPDLYAMLALSQEEFLQRFRGTPIYRTKRRGLLRNACIALGNLGDTAAISSLTTALKDIEPLVRGHAAWALGQLASFAELQTRLVIEEDAWVREEIACALANRAPEESGAR